MPHENEVPVEHYPESALRRFTTNFLLALGATSEEAEIIADGLTTASLWWHPGQGQGLEKLFRYHRRVKNGGIVPDATMEWVDGNLGSKITMKYPAVYLTGEGAHGEILSIAFAGRGQHQDAGGKVVHVAGNTTSRIICGYLKPSAMAPSNCPFGIACKPARTTSAI